MKELIIDIMFNDGWAYHSETKLSDSIELEFLRNGRIVKVRIEK